MSLLAFLLPLQVAAGAPPAPPAETATITLDAAVSAALARHPDVVVAGAQTKVADAQARQARAPLLPQVDVTGRYGYSWSESSGLDDGGGDDSWSASASAGLLLWDFGQTRNRWRSALAASEAAGQDAESVRQAIALDARLAFFDALETKALIQVARENLQNQETHLRQ